ncbi:threonine/homoserine/homoserine lactone efflux protein [Streptomyces sp. V3I8]|jgi:threonine/homoserine/homoserine lactone efflux protein|uniref:LysE family translocator n=1 Tax=Streptomyces sp. V3I8 TaxID=3042279 RepID=UPI0027890043|nr:LysE family translocator [Streptomyces sp. V3I8]MDQ1034095.1 threonine/homoserine/homoserine lactone efflux protein [Streptomyces sp. V3I8]
MSVDLTGFLAVVLLAYLIPGPDFLVVVRAAARRPALGRAAGLGAQAGLCVHMCAAALGLSAVATRSALAFTVIKLAGAAYLVFLGVRALLDARRRDHDRSAPPPRTAVGGPAAAPGRQLTRRDSFLQGFLTNVLNPKAALFFLSVLPQFVGHGGSPTRQIFLLGVLDVAVGVVYWLALVSVAGRLRTAFGPACRRRWELVSGWLFIAIGVGVAATE